MPEPPMKPLFLLLLTTLALPSAADLYQWTDENGKVHFSDKQPGNAAAKVIPKPEPVHTGTGGTAQSAAEVARIAAEKREQQQADTENAQEKQRRCADARESYQYWLDRKPYTINQQNGRKEYYHEPRHDRHLRDAADYMQRKCKGL